jgi:AcrR family transcriptional regulator
VLTYLSRGVRGNIARSLRSFFHAAWYAGDCGPRLGHMGRPKTISDDAVLRIARQVFREHGHTATTREVARAAGISEPILYRRFGSKDALFFAAMHAQGPEIDELLGPEDPPGDGREYLLTVLHRLAAYFGEVIPLALRVMMHPSFDPESLTRTAPGGPAELREGLAKRLASLARRRQLSISDEVVLARLLLSIAHDRALGVAFAHGSVPTNNRRLEEFLEVLWEGLRPKRSRGLHPGL